MMSYDELVNECKMLLTVSILAFWRILPVIGMVEEARLQAQDCIISIFVMIGMIRTGWIRIELIISLPN